MGSDLYMEQRNFRPRPNKAEWVNDTLVLSKDVFYEGYVEVWRGVPSDETKPLIKAMGFKIPDKPLPDPRIYTLANILHRKKCRLQHEDQCGWEYEIGKDKNEWEGANHKHYFTMAQELVNRFSGTDLDELLAIVSAV